MKAKVVLYLERTLGSPLTPVTDIVSGEVNSYEEVTPLIISCLTQGQSFIKHSEIITSLGANPISRWFDIVNLQVHLRENGLVLQVTGVTDELEGFRPTGTIIEVITPKGDLLLPISTTFFSETSNFNIPEICDRIKDKFAIGDERIVPESDINYIARSIKDMSSKGMTIFSEFSAQFSGKLLDYGFTMYYIYMQ